MTMRLLAVGDLHLGRRPGRLPEMLGDRDRARELGPAGAWQRLVTAAVTHRVDAVLLAGDLVEREDDFFEAYRQLYAGTRTLAEAGIAVIGVAGNHDVHVLPRLADELPAFTLLGRDGRWQRQTLTAGGEHVSIWGWSFPSATVRDSPLAGQSFERTDGTHLGLLHCDRDQAASRYAPVGSRELDAAGLDGWLLGHIHKPDTLTAPNPVGYLGSVTGLDPGEPGPRGPWLLAIEGGRIDRVEHWTLAPLRWQRLDLALDGVETVADARVQLLGHLRELDRTLTDAPWVPEAVGLRVRLTGRSSLAVAIPEAIQDDERGQIFAGEAGTHYFIERFVDATLPQRDLEALARRSDPPGLLAQRLLLLERPADDPERARLLASVRDALAVHGDEPRFAALAPEPMSDEAVAEQIRSAANRLLDAMAAQQEAAS